MSYKELYKKGVDLGELQKKRQQEVLNQIKTRRQLEQDALRDVKDSDDEDDSIEEILNTPSDSKQGQHKQRNRRNKRQQRLRLQLSEWLRHRPENLGDWMLLPCPVGKRCLVIACNGRTKVYNKAGHLTMQLRSQLPGDGYAMRKLKTVLDCVYVKELDTFYVLDALSFGQQLLLDCDASFRFFWLRSRFDEQTELSERSQRNEKPFKLLAYYDFEDAKAVELALQRYPQWEGNQPQLDGLLFYHKEANYTYGSTPLVCWLFAFMVPDILILPVHSGYEAPKDYVPNDVLAYMDKFDQKLLEQRKRGEAKKTEKSTDAYDAVAAATATNMDEGEEDVLEEFKDLRNLLDHQRLLELGELDMDCSPTSADVDNSR